MSPAPGPSGSFSRGRAACLPGQLRALRSEHAPPRGGGGLALHFGEPLLWLCPQSPEDSVQTRALGQNDLWSPSPAPSFRPGWSLGLARQPSLCSREGPESLYAVGFEMREEKRPGDPLEAGKDRPGGVRGALVQPLTISAAGSIWGPASHQSWGN